MTTVTFSWTTVLLTILTGVLIVCIYFAGIWWSDNDRRKRIASRVIFAVIALAFIAGIYVSINLWQQLLATH